MIDPTPRVRQLGNDILNRIEKWTQSYKQLNSVIENEVLLNQKISSIEQIPLFALKDWAMKSKEKLINIDQTTKEALVACKNQVPKNYLELIDDLKIAENIRSKETAFLGEKIKLQSLFGHKFR